ncbi:MAG TPA: hypothetical protein VGZ90_02010 [Puia sp.]|nr:hypothetical protein [Puia sp.]
MKLDLKLRSRHPHHDKELARLTIEELLTHYEDIIKSLPEKRILIGHSYGGLMTQISEGTITDYKVISGRNHFVLGQPIWKEDAEYIYDWIKNKVKVNLTEDEVLLAGN